MNSKMLPCVAVLTVFLFLILASQGSVAQTKEDEMIILGAGASFPNPLYQQWAKMYQAHAGITISYDSIGSGGGQKAIKEKRVLFGGSDAPMSSSQLEKFNLLQFPMVTGAIIAVVNIDGLNSGGLRLTGDVLARIFLREIRSWRDPAILDLQNEEIADILPDEEIVVVVREDSSGSTWVFTSYLDRVSESWRNSPLEFGKKPGWESDIEGNTNDGVAMAVKDNANSIGYVEYAYLNKYSLTSVALENQHGGFVTPSPDVFSGTAEHVDWNNISGNFEIDMINLPGEQSWPILATTYILVHKQQPPESAIRELLKFFSFCFSEGREKARELNYVPLPAAAVKKIEDNVWPQIHINGERVWK